jgi:hypothetical protein
MNPWGLVLLLRCHAGDWGVAAQVHVQDTAQGPHLQTTRQAVVTAEWRTAKWYSLCISWTSFHCGAVVHSLRQGSNFTIHAAGRWQLLVGVLACNASYYDLWTAAQQQRCCCVSWLLTAMACTVQVSTSVCLFCRSVDARFQA